MDTNSEKSSSEAMKKEGTANSQDGHEEDAKKFLDFDDFNQFYEVLVSDCKSAQFLDQLICLSLFNKKKAFSKTIKETVGASSKIPIRSNELDYYMTFPSFKSFVTQQNDRILKT